MPYEVYSATFPDGAWYRFVTSDIEKRKVVDREDAERDEPRSWFGKVIKAKGAPRYAKHKKHSYKRVQTAIEHLKGSPRTSEIDVPWPCDGDDYEYSAYDDSLDVIPHVPTDATTVRPQPWLSEEAGEALELTLASHDRPDAFFRWGDIQYLVERIFKVVFRTRHPVPPVAALYDTRLRVTKSHRVLALGPGGDVLELSLTDFVVGGAPWLLERFEIMAKKVLGGMQLRRCAVERAVVERNAYAFLRSLYAYNDDCRGPQKHLVLVPSKRRDIVRAVREIMANVDPNEVLRLSKLLYVDDKALSDRERAHLRSRAATDYNKEKFERELMFCTTAGMARDMYKHVPKACMEEFRRFVESKGWPLPADEEL